VEGTWPVIWVACSFISRPHSKEVEDTVRHNTRLRYWKPRCGWEGEEDISKRGVMRGDRL